LNKTQLIFKAIKQIRDHRIGYCPFCESKTLFLRVDKGTRENYFCIKCDSWSRKRHVAETVCKVLNVTKLSDLSKAHFAIYNTSVNSFFNRFLLNNKSFIRSEYITTVPFGTQISERLYSQDLERLTFQNNSFDLVITEDVLEHVRNLDLALKEIHRVLKVGGYHVFTVPINLAGNMVIRIDTSGKEDIDLLPREYHNDGDNMIVSYRTFGKDTPEVLAQYGFSTEILQSDLLEQKSGIFSSVVIVTRKI
jgi:SAM-dependent methyltransferase